MQVIFITRVVLREDRDVGYLVGTVSMEDDGYETVIVVLSRSEAVVSYRGDTENFAVSAAFAACQHRVDEGDGVHSMSILALAMVGSAVVAVIGGCKNVEVVTDVKDVAIVVLPSF